MIERVVFYLLFVVVVTLTALWIDKLTYGQTHPSEGPEYGTDEYFEKSCASKLGSWACTPCTQDEMQCRCRWCISEDKKIGEDLRNVFACSKRDDS